MQKKILFPIITLLLLLFFLPIIGNIAIKIVINEQLESLKSKGISYKVLEDESGYFKSRKSYSFTISEREKFLDFIVNQAHQQVPPYLDMLLDGMQIGIDAEYANIPLFDLLSLDIYPMKLADKQMQALKKESEDSYKKLEHFFSQKSLLYHIDYDLVAMKFSGYLKDINDGVMFKKANKIEFALKDVKFSGSGLLIQPDSYVSDIKKFDVSLSSFSREIMSLKVEDLHSKGNFSSKLEFDTSLKLANFFLKVRQDRVYDSSIEVDDLDTQLISTVEGEKLKLTIDTLFKELKFQAQGEKVDLNDSKFHFKATQIDKQSFLEAQKAFKMYQESQSSKREQLSLQKNLEFISKGMRLDLKEFSIENVLLNGVNLGSLYSKVKIDVKEDKQLFKKLEQKSEALKNITMRANFEFSKELFNLFKKYSPSFVFLENVAIEKEGRYSFDITLKDAKTHVNGKQL